MYYVIILVLLFLTELFYFRVADKFNIIDNPMNVVLIHGLLCVVVESSSISELWPIS